MTRARPVLSDAPLTAFGKTMPARPINPSNGQTMEYHLGDARMPPNTPSVDRTFKFYVGGKQARPDAPYVRAVVSPAGKVLGQVGAIVRAG